MKAMLLGIALVLLAAPVQAQDADARWSTWLGCWELVTEDVRDVARPGRLPLRQLEDGRPRICITPAPDGARFETLVSDQPAVSYTIVPNGSDQPLTETECRGTQRAEWSADGRRLYSRAELTCGTDTARRRVSTLALIAPNGQWIDVQAVTLEGRESVRVRRYRHAGDAGTSTQRMLGNALSLDAVKEASGKVSPLAIEAALIETNAGYDLSAKRLLELDEAGVPDSVIDLMVALSYPDKFIVERTARATATTTYINDPWALGWGFGHPIWYDDFYASSYYYSPYASRYGFNSAYGPGSVFVIPSGGGSIEPQPSGAGRVVDGLGYTRVRPREPEPAVRNTGSTASTFAGAGSGPAPSSGSSGSSSSGSSGSSSGGASSGGSSSSGSSSGDTGRTAVPR